MNKEIFEPRSPKSLISSIWTSAHAKPKKNSWHLLSKRQRSELPAIAPTIKPVTNGKIKGGETKMYRYGPYVGSLEEIKEFAAFKGETSLTMGACRIKVAAA